MKRLILLFFLLPTLCFADSENTFSGNIAQSHIIQNSGLNLPPRPYLNFTGTSVSCADSGGKTVCTINGGASIGGAITGGTAGSVLFVNPDSTLSQDNSHFFWDDSLDQLALGGSNTELDALTVNATSGGATINGVSTGIGGIDTFTKLMLHLDNNVTDSEITPKTITNNGVTFTNTAGQFKFSYAGTFNGGSGYLDVPTSTDFDFGSSTDFTIDLWYRPTALTTPGAGILLNTYNGTSGYFIQWSANGTQIEIYDGSTDTSLNYNSQLNTYQHFEMDRSGSTITVYINGTSIGTVPNGTYNSNGHDALIGIYFNFSSSPFRGQIDEFRISKGVARHTTNFTPPASPYTLTGMYVPTLTLAGNSSTLSQIKTSSTTNVMSFINNGFTGLTLSSAGNPTFPLQTTNGFCKTSGGTGVFNCTDTNTYLTANQTITLSGDVSGSGTTAITATASDFFQVSATEELATNLGGL